VAGRARPLRRGREPGKRPAASPGSHRRPSSSWLWTEGLQVSAGLSGLETGLASSRLGVLGGWRELLDSSPWAAVSEALFCVLGSRRPVGNPAGCKRRGVWGGLGCAERAGRWDAAPGARVAGCSEKVLRR
jgi:hypothetical protein